MLWSGLTNSTVSSFKMLRATLDSYLIMDYSEAVSLFLNSISATFSKSTKKQNVENVLTGY